MHTRRWRRIVVGMLLGVGAAGFVAVAPPRAGAIAAGMTLGHVPQAPAAMSATIVIGPNAAINGYSTKVVTISQGEPLSVVNLDDMDHTVTSVARNAKGLPLFNANAGAGTTTAVPAARTLAAGTYDFFCEIHPNMRGELIVEGSPSVGTHPVAPTFDQRLRVPKILTGSHLRIVVRRAAVKLLPHGPKTWMWTYDGTYPGPTIRRPAGHDTKVTFVNDLPKVAGAITVHLHGDHHSAASDGQPDVDLIQRGRGRTYDYPLTDDGKPEPEAFDFYHDHRMNETGRNNWNGLQGMFIVDNPDEQALDLPSGPYDVPLMVTDRSFTAENQLTDPFPAAGTSAAMSVRKKGPHAPPGDATVGDQILVDGRVGPYLPVTTHRYRLQLLDASNFQSYDFAFSDGRPFVQIGTGDDLLPAPVIRQSIVLGPSQRADVIVDFHGELHQNVVLESIASTSRAPSGIGTPTAAIMQFRVIGKVADHTRILPKLLPPPRISAPRHPSMTWTFGLGGNPTTGTFWTVNGKPFDPRRVDVEVPLGSTQTWLLRNMSSVTHYIHLHEEQWHTLRRDGKAPPPWERGLEDTWRLDPGETVEVAARFTDFTGVFMVHCHMLDHEDDGMMAQFAVVAPHTTKLPPGYYLDKGPGATARAGAMTMSASMPMKVAAAAQPPPWRLVRFGGALSVELAALLAAMGLCRYRRRPWSQR